jgi:hypothetical protein
LVAESSGQTQNALQNGQVILGVEHEAAANEALIDVKLGDRQAFQVG